MIALKQTYDILFESQPDGKHQASVLGWSSCQAIGDTEEQAIDSLRQVLNDRLTYAKILQLEIPQQSIQPIVESDNPWIKYAGVFKDDPMFDEMLELIAEHRRKKESSRPLSDIFTSIDQLMWTPPEGARTGLEMIHEDRDS